MMHAETACRPTPPAHRNRRIGFSPPPTGYHQRPRGPVTRVPLGPGETQARRQRPCRRAGCDRSHAIFTAHGVVARGPNTALSGQVSASAGPDHRRFGPETAAEARCAGLFTVHGVVAGSRKRPARMSRIAANARGLRRRTRRGPRARPRHPLPGRATPPLRHPPQFHALPRPGPTQAA